MKHGLFVQPSLQFIWWMFMSSFYSSASTNRIIICLISIKHFERSQNFSDSNAPHVISATLCHDNTKIKVLFWSDQIYLHSVDQPDCSSDPEPTSRFCSADWSWRGTQCYREETENQNQNQNQSLCWVLTSLRGWPDNKHTDSHWATVQLERNHK